MSNTNNNLQTQTSNALHNAIIEAGGKDRPPMLAPGNYFQWKSKIKRYIDTKPNNELIHYCLQNPPYKFEWTEKTIPVAEGSLETTTKGYIENYKNVSQDIRNRLDVEAEKSIERLKQCESINVQDLETNLYWEFGKFTSRDGESLESYYSSQNSSTRSQQAPTRNRSKAIVNSPLPIYNQEPKMVAEGDALSKEKEIDKLMALISLSFNKIYKPTNNNLRTSSNTSIANKDNTPRITEALEQADWRDDTDDEPANQELEAYYIEHPEQPESANGTYLEKPGDTSITIDSLDMSTTGEMVDQDDDDLAKERDLLDSLIDKLKCEIDDSKNRNKLLESSNKTLVDKLKGEIRGCYNDNLALMLAPDSDETIRLDKESRSKLSDLIRPFDYDQLNNLYDLFVPQREKSSEQQYFSKASNMSHTYANNEISNESFNTQTTLLEQRMDESTPWDQKCKSSKELLKIKRSVDIRFDGVERCKQTIAKRTYFGNIDPFIQNIIEGNFCHQIRRINADLEIFYLCLKEEMIADLRYFNILEHEVDSLKSQLETQKTQFFNEIDRLLWEYYYADHMNAILGVYTDIDEVSNLQCDYLKTLEKCEHLEKELSKSRTMLKSFEALHKHAINLELDLQQCKEKIKNDKCFKENQPKVFLNEREQYFDIQDLKAQLQDKKIAISELKKLIEKIKGKYVETKFEKS
ncbi:hypothetical protein Tco_1286046 [Tanacetum coccineum]